jgi:phage-related protein
MATFTWTPDLGAGMDREPRIRSAQFGDGYTQRALDGLNADMRTRTLSFTVRSLAESQAIQAFLEARGGVESFDYTHPGDTSRKYVCKSWKATDTAYNVQDVSATFIQVPA